MRRFEVKEILATICVREVWFYVISGLKYLKGIWYTNNMQSNFFAYMYRMKLIGRWSLMKSNSPENVAEHSLMTAMIAHALGVINRDVMRGSVDPDRLAVLAIYHEAGEVLTGDLPTPIKYANDELRQAYKSLERKAEQKLVNRLPEEFRETYAPLVKQLGTAAEQQLVKAADKISALIKCKEEVKCGNKEFQRALETTNDAVNQLDLAEVTYFIEHFLPAFDKTLDELEDGWNSQQD